MSKKNTTYFNDQWLSDNRFCSWIEKCDSKTSARCKLCSKVIELSSMGVSSLLSHASGKKHKDKHLALKSSITLKSSTSTSCPESSSSAKVVQSETSGTLDQYVKKTNVTHAEILWALKVVMSKLSLRSCEELRPFSSNV